MNDATELLMRVSQETNFATALLQGLVAAAQTEVLRAEEVQPCIHALTRHLRNAASASEALANLANGMKPPRRGESED